MSLFRLFAGGAGGGSAAADFGLLCLRLVIGYGLIGHGWQKLPPGQFIESVAKMGLPEPIVFAWMAALSEFLGGILVGLGFFTRLGALFALSTMVVALVGHHRHDPFAIAELAWVYAGALLLFLIAGGGRYAFERVFQRAPGISSKRTTKKRG
jgi:putative oxidoreductase